MSPALKMLIGAVMISFSAPLVRFVEVAPTTSAFYRMAIGGAVLMAWMLARYRHIQITKRAALWIVATAFFFALDLIFWHRSIWYIGPGLATILANFQVFVLALAAVALYGERVGWRFAFAVGLAIAGLWLMVGLEWSALPQQYHIGVILGLATAVAYSLYMLSLRRVQERHGLDAATILTWSTVICAVILALVNLYEGHSFAIPNWQTGSALVAYGVFCQVFGWLLITSAITRLSTAVVGLMLLLQPALSFLWDVIFFDRPTTTVEMVGAGLALIGIYIGLTRRPRTRTPTPS